MTEDASATAGVGGSSRSKLTGRAAVLVLVLAVLAVSYASSTRAWIRQRGEINQLSADIAAQQAYVAELQQEQRRWHDPAYIKTQARLRFGWVMPGETGYRVIGDDGEVIADSASSLSDPLTTSSTDNANWWDQAWDSVVTAGEDPATAADSEPERSSGAPAGHIDRDGREDRLRQGERQSSRSTGNR